MVMAVDMIFFSSLVYLLKTQNKHKENKTMSTTCPVIPGFKDALEFSKSLNEREQKAFSEFLTVHTKANDPGKTLAELVMRLNLTGKERLDPSVIGRLFVAEQPVTLWTLKFAEIVAKAKEAKKNEVFSIPLLLGCSTSYERFARTHNAIFDILASPDSHTENLHNLIAELETASKQTAICFQNLYDHVAHKLAPVNATLFPGPPLKDAPDSSKNKFVTMFAPTLSALTLKNNSQQIANILLLMRDVPALVPFLRGTLEGLVALSPNIQILTDLYFGRVAPFKQGNEVITAMKRVTGEDSSTRLGAFVNFLENNIKGNIISFNLKSNATRLETFSNYLSTSLGKLFGLYVTTTHLAQAAGNLALQCLRGLSFAHVSVAAILVALIYVVIVIVPWSRILESIRTGIGNLGISGLFSNLTTLLQRASSPPSSSDPVPMKVGGGVAVVVLISDRELRDLRRSMKRPTQKQLALLGYSILNISHLSPKQRRHLHTLTKTKMKKQN